VLFHQNSSPVAMEVGTRQEVCNNLTAKWSGPENWWRSNMQLLPCLPP